MLHTAALDAACRGCTLPASGIPERDEPRTLFLWPSAGHSLAHLAEILGRGGMIAHPRIGLGCLAVATSSSALPDLVNRLVQMISSDEAAGIRALETAEPTPSLRDVPRMAKLSDLWRQLQRPWLVNLLQGGHLISHFQPIVSAMAPKEVFAYEALMRGQCEGTTLIPPAALLDVARGTDLLPQLDHIARRSAVVAASSAIGGANLFINVAPSVAANPDYCLCETERALKETNLAPHRVVFEITESEQVTDREGLQALLRRLRADGYRVALDDVGEGYASLALLRDLQPDFIKVDRSLVQGVDGDHVKAAIVGKLIELAQALEIRTVLEGIERQEELHWARRNGADYVQGYLLGRPGPITWDAERSWDAIESAM